MLCKEHGATVLGVCMVYDVFILNRDNILRYSTCYAINHNINQNIFSCMHVNLFCVYMLASFLGSLKAGNGDETMHIMPL